MLNSHLPDPSDEQAFEKLADEELEKVSGGNPTPDDQYYGNDPAPATCPPYCSY